MVLLKKISKMYQLLVIFSVVSRVTVAILLLATHLYLPSSSPLMKRISSNVLFSFSVIRVSLLSGLILSSSLYQVIVGRGMPANLHRICSGSPSTCFNIFPFSTFEFSAYGFTGSTICKSYIRFSKLSSLTTFAWHIYLPVAVCVIGFQWSSLRCEYGVLWDITCTSKYKMRNNWI